MRDGCVDLELEFGRNAIVLWTNESQRAPHEIREVGPTPPHPFRAGQTGALFSREVHHLVDSSKAKRRQEETSKLKTSPTVGPHRHGRCRRPEGERERRYRHQSLEKRPQVVGAYLLPARSGTGQERGARRSSSPSAASTSTTSRGR